MPTVKINSPEADELFRRIYEDGSASPAEIKEWSRTFGTYDPRLVAQAFNDRVAVRKLEQGSAQPPPATPTGTSQPGVPPATGVGATPVRPGVMEISDDLRKRLLAQQTAISGQNADQAWQNANILAAESAANRDYLRRVAAGEESVSAEQLRQGLQQGLAQQQSIAAGAAPRNQAMAARTAAIQSGRMSAGLSGQQAIAGMQERKDAQTALTGATLTQRGQDLQASQAGRQGALAGYGAYTQSGAREPDDIEKYGPAAIAVLTALSDERAKRNIRGAEGQSLAMAKSIRPYAFDYRDQRMGAGKQLGVMAQDLERNGLRQAVINTPHGKMVDGAKLATANTAMIGALARRLAELEGKR